jgi:hypothetical protein
VIWARKFGDWTFEILWSYGISIGIREIRPPRCGRSPHGWAIDVPLLIFTVWR